MPTRSAKAEWQGTVQDGSGNVKLAGADYPYSFRSRFDENDLQTTNPEEMIAAAQATCYNMALSARLNQHNITLEHIESICKVTLSPSGIGFKISRITIDAKARVPGITDEEFQKHAAIAKDNCPISNALLAVNVVLNAELID
jgi:osmotically inducible protein OsmC